MNTIEEIRQYIHLGESDDGLSTYVSQESVNSAIDLITRLTPKFGQPKNVCNHEGVGITYANFKVDLEDNDCFDVFFNHGLKSFADIDSCVSFINSQFGTN